MKKTELIARVAETGGLTKAQAASAVDAVIGAIVEVGAQQDTLVLPGLGTFKGKTRPERQGRNPSNGEAITVPEKKVLTFKASTALKI